jgi:hypothetical protein
VEEDCSWVESLEFGMEMHTQEQVPLEITEDGIAIVLEMNL